MVQGMQIEGIEKLYKNLRKVNDEAYKVMTASLKEAGGVVLDAAKSKVSEKTGNLKRNIKLSTVKGKTYKKYIDVKVGEKAYYGRYLEYGTSKMAAKPFLVPALLENRDKVNQIMAENMKRGLNL